MFLTTYIITNIFYLIYSFRSASKISCLFLICILTFFRLKQLISHLKEDDATEVDTETVISNLEYISEVIQAIVLKTE